MKTAAKVFLIIQIIFTFWAIYPLVLGIIACKKLDESKDIKEIHGWGIVCLFLVSLIGGIIMLVMKEEDLYDSPEEAAAAKAQQAAGQGWTRQNAGGTPYYCGYDDRGGYYDGYGGYYDAAGGYYAPDGSYYPPRSNG